MTHRVLISVLAGACALVQPMSAQSSGLGGGLAVRGVVFDSLRGQPLRDAFVTIAGGKAIMTDTRGRFRFENVAAGVHVVTAQHPLLDSIGLSGLTARATVAGDGREIRLSVPSFETLWRLSCVGRPPKDSGMVFGTIRDAVTGAPVASAAIELSWSDLNVRSRRIVERVWRIQTRSNERGGYAVCGVSPEADLRIQATGDSSDSGLLDMPPAGVRIQRRDILVGPTGSTRLGVIAGTIADPEGRGLAGARVVVEGGPEVRSDPEGRFVLTGVRPGTRQVEVLSLGAAPSVATVDVTPHDTARLTVRLSKVHSLEIMKTTSKYGARTLALEFDERRKRGFGYTRDSIHFLRYDQFLNALRDVPGMTVNYRGVNLSLAVSDGKGGNCSPDVLIDGAPGLAGHLIDLLPAEIGGLEVYNRAAQIPARFVPTGIRPQCGMVLVWTKYGFRNR